MSDNSSENSLLKADSAADLNSKYNRLATEYSKLRAQNTVLKKAVLEEQAKNNELNDTVRSKNQMMRKLDLEMEALKFRNSQLSVRLTVLQEELDSLSNKSNKKKTKHSESSNGIVNSTFIDAEIEKTMMEHAKLISELSRKDEKYEEEVKALKNAISNLNYELEQKDIKMKQIIEEHQSMVEQLKREHRDMKRDYANKVVKLKETEVELSALKNLHKVYVEENEPKLNALNKILPKKNPFSDESIESLNKLNVRFSAPQHDEESHIKQLQKNVSTLFLTFYNVIHNVTLELNELGFEELRMFIKTLLRNEDRVQLHEKLNSCYHLLSKAGLELDDPNSMQRIVHEFIRSFLDFVVLVDSSYFDVNHSTRYNNSVTCHIIGVPVKVALEMFQVRKNELVAKVITLPNSQHAIIHDEFQHFNDAIQNLVTVIDLIDKNRQENPSNKLESNAEFKKKTTSYLLSLKKEPAERIVYEEALKNNIQLQEYKILNNSLKNEIKSLEDTIVSLEQENAQIKNECEIRNNSNTQKQIFIENPDKSSYENTNELGKYVTPYEISDEILAREKATVKHMNNKINALIIEKQEALSRARNYILECKTLQRRLEYCATEKQLLEQKYLKSFEASSELKEELNTVSQNYESHLSVLSEHLANVNEKLATQSEEIDKLHYHLNNKVPGSKKNKLK